MNIFLVAKHEMDKHPKMFKRENDPEKIKRFIFSNDPAIISIMFESKGREYEYKIKTTDIVHDTRFVYVDVNGRQEDEILIGLFNRQKFAKILMCPLPHLDQRISLIC